MRLFAAISLLLLAGCAARPFTANPRVAQTVVEWRIVDDADRTCRELGTRVPMGYRIQACVSLQTDLAKCVIYTPRETTMEYLGHELRHCFKGMWHD